MSLFTVNKEKEYKLCHRHLDTDQIRKEYDEEMEGLEISWVTMLFKRYPLLCFIPVLIQSILFAINDTFSTCKWPAAMAFLTATALLPAASATILVVFSEVLLPAAVVGLAVIIFAGLMVGSVSAIKQTIHNHNSKYFERFACENTVSTVIEQVSMPQWKQNLKKECSKELSASV